MADTSIAGQPRRRHHHRRIAREMLASSSRSPTKTQACGSQVPVWAPRISHLEHLDARPQGQQQPWSTKKGKAFSAYAKGFWLLLALFLVPHAQALPSACRIQVAQRSAAVERGPTAQLFEPHQGKVQRQVKGAVVEVDAGAGYLDPCRLNSSSAAGKGKQRDLGESSQRRSAVFPPVVAVNSTNSTDSNGDGRTLTIILEQSDSDQAKVTVEAPGQRWGQTATYLASHNVVLVVGGQTGLSGDITNDVFALDMSEMSNLTSNSTSQNWQRLSSDGLPAHAYSAASTVVDPVTGEEKLWIVGGVAQNCATDAPAYVWSAPVGNITAGKWTAVYSEDGIAPSRRRGAKAVTLSSTNSSSIMVVGGTFDSTTCSSNNGTYAGIDMWSPTSSFSPSAPSLTTASSAAVAHVGLDLSGAIYSHISSLALDPRMTDLSLTDYTTVTLPANGTCGEKVLFLGGKDASNTLAPLSTLWALDVSTGDWEHWNTTGLIPSPRLGHTAVVTPDGKIMIHGGYLQDPTLFSIDNQPVGEVFILDPHQSPARWDAAVWTSKSTSPPAVAFHSAVMAGEVMMVSFGKMSDGPADTAGQSFLVNSGVASSQVHFLDTSTMGSAGGMAWSSSTEGVAQARQAISGALAADAPPAAPATQAAPAVAPVTEPTASPPVEATPDPPAPSSEKAPSSTPEDKPAPPPTNSSPSSSPSSPSSSHTGAIAGSLLGAAALAAAIGGIYAYRKRREAAACNLGRCTNFTPSPHHNDADEEKGAPPVSNLHLAARGGWGARLKRAASSLTKSQSRSSTAAQVEGEDKFTTMRNAAPASGVQLRDPALPTRAEVPDEFITSLLVADDDSPFHTIPLGRGEFLHPHAPAELLLNHSNHSRGSLSSGQASHFSYPYLATVQRSTSPTSPRVKRVILGTPESTHELSMSPGDVVSPYHLPRNPFASPDSVFWDEEEEDSDTAVAMDDRSAVNDATPLFPWETPVIAPPPRAKTISTGEARLRVMNAV